MIEIPSASKDAEDAASDATAASSRPVATESTASTSDKMADDRSSEGANADLSTGPARLSPDGKWVHYTLSNLTVGVKYLARVRALVFPSV